MEKKKFCVIGGDLRLIKLYEALLKDGFDSRIFGFDRYDGRYLGDFYSGLWETVKNANYIILPLPCTLDKETLNMPYSDEKITFPELFSKISSKSIVFAGKIPENIKKLAEEKGIRLFDYFEREEMIVLNTIATAEGAVEIAMNELPITIHSAKILVTGFGRVSKTLCTVLKALNANLFVAARKKSDIAWIKTLGYTPLSFDKAKEIAGSFEIVFNTVPEKVLDGAFLSVLKPDTLVIDLASKPGGVDMEKAAEYNVKTIWALSLPGKVAPVTSGEIIKETVLNMIEELG